MTAIEERADEEKIALTQQWRDAMMRPVHNVIVSTLEASETIHLTTRKFCSKDRGHFTNPAEPAPHQRGGE
jgi:hypothetical protein